MKLKNSNFEEIATLSFKHSSFRSLVIFPSHRFYIKHEMTWDSDSEYDFWTSRDERQIMLSTNGNFEFWRARDRSKQSTFEIDSVELCDSVESIVFSIRSSHRFI